MRAQGRMFALYVATNSSDPIEMKLLASCLLPILGLTLTPQQPATLKGQVTDQNGAIVVGAKITVRSSSGQAKTTATDTPLWSG